MQQKGSYAMQQKGSYTLPLPIPVVLNQHGGIFRGLTQPRVAAFEISKLVNMTQASKDSGRG